MSLRSLLYLFVFLIVLACTSNVKMATINNDRETWALKGKVKNLNEINFAESGKYVTNLLFNTEGNVIHQSGFNSDGSLIRRWEYEYENGIKKLRRCYVKNDSLSCTLLYVYNQNKNLISNSIQNNADSSHVSTVFEYDSDNNPVKETNYAKDGTVEGTTTNKFNRDNRLEESEKHDYILKSTIIQAFKYNSSGLMTEESFYRPGDKKIMQRIVYHYGTFNKPASIITYGPEERILEKKIVKYDQNGNITETLILDDKQVQKKQTVTYIYDRYGNWVRSILRNDETTSMIIERKYDYYK